MDDMEMWGELFERSTKKVLVMQEGAKKVINAEIHFDRPLLGKILILPRESAEQFTYTKPWACISISDAFSPNAKIQSENILYLRFDDIQRVKPGRIEFNQNHAGEICDFVNKVWSKVDLLMIHCNAGLCRSPAVGKIISELYQPDKAELFTQLYNPNPWVEDVFRGFLKSKECKLL